MQIFRALSEINKDMAAKLNDWVQYFPKYDRMYFIQYVLICILSSLICCIGLNFDSKVIVYGAVLISPFTHILLYFIIGLYTQDLSSSLRSLSWLIIGSVIATGVGYLYFKFSPFAYHPDFIAEMSSIPMGTYLAVFALAIGIGLYQSYNFNVFLWVLALISKWIVLFIQIGVHLLTLDVESAWDSIISAKLIFLMVFMGMYIKLIFMRVSRLPSLTKLRRLIFYLFTALLFAVGIYFTYAELRQYTTSHNVKHYLENELESQSFHIHNFNIDHNTKEIVIYYTGTTPPSAQEDRLKSKYHFQSYHLVFQEVK